LAGEGRRLCIGEISRKTVERELLKLYRRP
jgi:hypothetical protein